MTDTPSFDVRFTAAAEADVRAIDRYLKEQASPEIAKAFRANILARIDALERFPFRGSIPIETAAMGSGDVRQQSVPPYRIMYQIVERTVFIIMVIDGRRDARENLRRRVLRVGPA